MHRILHDTADANLNGFGKAGFIGGNPATGILATRLTPDWCNALQEEIANAIEAAGLTLSSGDNSQLAQAIQAVASSYAFSGAWSDVTGKPIFAPVATSGAYGDLSGTPNLSDVLRTSSLRSSTLAESGACGPAITHIAIEDEVISSFGDTQGYLQYPDFNHTPNAWGWSYVYGTANRPPVGGSQGGYRCRVSIGAGYGNHAMELCYGRPSVGGDGYTPYVRHAAYNSWGSWKKINAGNADTLGGYDASAFARAGTGWPGVYMGSVGNETNFPIGHVVLCTSNGNPYPQLNSSVSPYVNSSSIYYKCFGTANGPYLSGTWKARGSIGNEVIIIQRIA
jgi:hypothetical protein